MKFERGSFAIATPMGSVKTAGWVTSELGLHFAGREWKVVHLDTGFAVMNFERVSEARALEIAEKVAALDCWDFIGPTGWENRQPDLPQLIAGIYREFGLQSRVVTVRPTTPAEEKAAAEVLAKREAGNG